MSGPRYKMLPITEENEYRLNELYSEKTRDGAIKINLERSPSFFMALKVEGFENTIYAVEDTTKNSIAGAGFKSLRKCFVNGESTKIGYLSGLRVGGKYRKTRAMAMIFKKLRDFYQTDNCKGYIFSVFNDNKKALKLLTSGKAGMPASKRIGQLNTFVFKPKAIKSSTSKDLIVRNATKTDIEDLVSFMNTEGKKHQFSNAFSTNDFTGDTGLLSNLSISDIQMAFKDNRLVGCLALWNQTGFRRWKVEGYSTPIRISRPILNVFLRLLDYPLLPPKNFNFNYRILSLIHIKNDKPNVFAALYNHALKDLKNKKNIVISASLFEKCNFIKVLPRFKFTFKSSIFICGWNDSQKFFNKIDNRIPGIEAGSL